MIRAKSIVWPIVLLVTAAVAFASLVQFAITFNGPPPFTPPVPIPEIVEGLKTGKVPERSRRWGRFIVEAGAHPGETGQPDHQRDAMIARMLGVPATEIEGRYSHVGPSWNGNVIKGPKPGATSVPGMGPGPIFRGEFTIVWKSPNGARTARSSPRPWLTDWHKVTLAATLGVLIVLGVAAWLIARAISSPIRNLARVAREARLGTRTSFPQQGPQEVRELATALSAMQSRILEQVEGRTTMLAAIAHDMGTPITRLAFYLEQLPDAARDRAQADIEEVRAMLAGVLRFARDERADARDRIELGSLIESLVDDMKAAGTPVEAESGPRIVIRGDSQSLRRLLANLIENAVRYGETARIAWRAEPGWAEITVADKGPGFPANADALFTPFVRGEASRNRTTGGTGLGLSIVRSVAEAHGGGVTLEQAPEGGGLVRIRLPIEPATQ